MIRRFFSRRSSHPRVCLIIVGLLWLHCLQATPFTRGLTAYENGEYATAREQLEAAVETEETPAARHNLALTYVQLASPAEAVWQLERAVALEPYNTDYRFKLGALRQQLGLIADEPAWYALAALALPLDGWVLLGTAAFWILVAALLLPKAAGRRATLGLKLARFIGALVCLLALPAIGWHLQQQKVGVVIASEATPLHAAPASGAPQSGSARPGERGTVLDTYQAFYQVETESGTTGWVDAERFRKIRQPDL